MTFNCPRCSSEFTKGAKFCQNCGCNLEIEFIENPICPQCKTTYPANTSFCIVDGSKLVRPEDLIPKCIICNTPYAEDIKFCPRDGGEVKVILTRNYPQPLYNYRAFGNYHTNKKYPKASLGNRFVAALLDGFIGIGLSIPAILFFIVGMEKLDRYDDDQAPGFFIAAFLFYIGPLVYGFIKDGLGQGQSWGKRPLDIMVVDLDNNRPCNKGKSFLRNLISNLIALIPLVGWMIEPILVLATDDGRKLGDKAANTQVIDKKNYT